MNTSSYDNNRIINASTNYANSAAPKNETIKASVNNANNVNDIVPKNEATTTHIKNNIADTSSKNAQESKPLRIVFMGTPEFASIVLTTLLKDSNFDICAVFTRPDAVRGRGKKLVPSAASVLAHEFGIPIYTPQSFYAHDGTGIPLLSAHKCGENRVVDASILAQIAQYQPDFIVVAAYGMILPQAVLRLAKYDAINIHASLLPRWRGAAPIQRAILAGDKETGVCVMRMESGLDTGAYCAFAATDVAQKTACELTTELAKMGANLLKEQLPLIANNDVEWVAQGSDSVSYADKLHKDELVLSPKSTVTENLRRVRASSAQTPARCVIDDQSLTVLEARVATDYSEDKTTRHETTRQKQFKLFYACSDGLLEICELKPDGRKAMSAKAYLAGKPSGGFPDNFANSVTGNITNESTNKNY